MNNWRPEGWKNPNEEYHDICDVPTVQDAEYGAYEAGADAILDALWKMAEESPTGKFILDSNIHHIYARIFDIPKEA